MCEDQCFTGNSGGSFRLRLVGTNDGIKVWNGPRWNEIPALACRFDMLNGHI